MPTAEHRLAAGPPAAGGAVTAAPRARSWAWVGLALVLGGALALRLWGVKTGLPYVYNLDEATHFVPRAIAMSSGNLDPGYFVNPPGLTYVLHLVFAVWLGGARSSFGEYARHPDAVFLVARVTVAVLGAAAVWLLYLAGARLFDRGVALLAAALEAVAFLPVFYGHFALNDAPTLLPLTMSLLGSALVLRRGRRRDYLLAGVGLGLACATKYTAGIAALPLLAALLARYLDAEIGERRRALLGAVLAGACALGAFLIANPYALLDFKLFHSDLVHQSSLSGEAQGKLGAPHESGIVYYLWSLTWGLGWAPSLAALGGAALVWRRERRLGWLLVPAPVLFLAFMGVQGRYFGRWLMPIVPIVCLLAAFFALSLATTFAGYLGRTWAIRARATLAGLASAALLAQGLLYTVHSDLVLARPDTRGLTRAWLVAHVPRHTPIVLEPVVPNVWLSEGGPAGVGHGSERFHPPRWAKYPALRSVIAPSGALAASSRVVPIEDYELTLSPALIDRYEQQGYCWVISGSTQSGRARARARDAPLALAYYRALEARASVAYRASPYAPGAGPVGFSFDWSFDYYPLAYRRPGPQMTVYRLHGGRCAAAGMATGAAVGTAADSRGYAG